MAEMKIEIIALHTLIPKTDIHSILRKSTKSTLIYIYIVIAIVQKHGRHNKVSFLIKDTFTITSVTQHNTRSFDHMVLSRQRHTEVSNKS